MPAYPQPGSPIDPYDEACDQAIATCGGDMRGTIKALLCANEFLEADLSKARAAASMGYIRQGLAKRKVIVQEECPFRERRFCQLTPGAAYIGSRI
jgi:hypothetical protein